MKLFLFIRFVIKLKILQVINFRSWSDLLKDWVEDISGIPVDQDEVFVPHYEFEFEGDFWDFF